MQPRILMIVTSIARMGATDKPTGLWAEELAVPYYRLLDAGARIEIASTAGGVVPFDPGSLGEEQRKHPDVARMLADGELKARLHNTRRAADFDASEFDAVFLPGGHGTMWDLPGDAGVTRAVEAAHANERVIGAVCHGIAGLVTARDAQGQPLVRGRRISAFTNSEEAAVGLTEVVPFALESRVRELGGNFDAAPDWTPHAVRDGLLVTGQNPQSSELVVKGMLEALGERR